MRLGCNHRIKLIILCLFSFISVDVFAIAQWSKVGYVYRINSKKDSSNDFDTSKCNLKTSHGMDEDGDPQARKDYLDVKLDQYSMVFNYGTNFESNTFADGAFKYAQRINFSVGDNYRKPLLSALKKALKAGNCDIAQSLVNALADGKVQKKGEDEEFLGFENGTDRCAISKDGSSVCAFNKEGSDEEGNPVIGVCNETNCDRDTLENYASSKQEAKRSSSDQGTTEANNGINELRGSGGNSGSSSGNANNDSSSSGSGGTNGGSGHSDKGTGNGKGLGTGKSEGDGDKDTGNGELSYPELEEFDIKKVFNELKKSKEGFIPNLSFSGGSCPPLDINFNTKFLAINEKIDVHCQVFKSAAESLGALFLFIWGVISLRVILSA